MGYKAWRTLSVFFALGAFTVGCTNGPQKSTNFGANSQPISKNQMAQSTAFPQAGQQAAQFNIPPQKQPNLPQINNPPGQFPQTTGLGNQPGAFSQTGSSGIQGMNNDLPVFPPKNNPPAFPNNSNVNPTGGVNNPTAPNTGFADRRMIEPINTTPPSQFQR